MHSDRMRTDPISEFIQVLYCRAVSCGDMYCIGYSLFDNVVCVQPVCTCSVQYCSHYSLV